MLSYLRIRGLALLDDVALEFSGGMNVLTGETGAGKSIVVGALALMRGERARSEIVRQGADATIIDAQFEPPDDAQDSIRAALDAHGLPAEDAEAVVMQRVVAKAGRGRALLQGNLTTLGVMAEVGEHLIDICSQHEHHFLTHTARHLEVLDAYTGLGDDLATYADRYRSLCTAQTDLAALVDKAAGGAARADYLRFQIDELQQVAPEAGEYEALRRRVDLMRDLSRWVSFAREAHAALYESDDAIAMRLAALGQQAQDGAEGSELLAEIQQQLVAAQVACEEAARAAERFGSELDVEPGELERAEDRLHELESLRRKHGVEPDQLADRLTEMIAEVDSLSHSGEHVEALRSRVEELRQGCKRLAAGLSRRRQKAAKGLGRAVEQELAALQMPGARLTVAVETGGELGPRGTDRVEFVFGANPGEALAPLRRVASGGELSRVLLALKGVLAAEDRVATYVFDEVDAGVGGAVAEAIGRRLSRAASGHQVLCITHLPQIAAFADAHFRVEKTTARGRTTATVRKLTDAERIEEIARMLGGARVGKSARAHAKQLIAEARA